MTYRDAELHTNRSKIELKTEFEDILEAMEEIGQTKEITNEMLNFWLYGSTLRNYRIYMNLLDAAELLKRSGIPAEYINNALSEHCPIDRYVLFKNACINFIGEEATADFQTLVINPLLKIYVEPSEKSKAEKLEELSKGRETIKALSKSISKTIQELQKIKPHHITGTDVESILITLENLEHIITHLDE